MRSPLQRFNLVALTISLAALALGAGCRTDVTPIKTLLDDPGRFDGKVVRIAGDVTGGVGILGYGAYQVDDGTGKLTVVTKEGGAPREGAKIGVEGTFQAAFTFKTESAAVLLEKQRYTP
jgi:hypothetical protein